MINCSCKCDCNFKAKQEASQKYIDDMLKFRNIPNAVIITEMDKYNLSSRIYTDC